MQIFLTGATGFVGRHMLAALCAEGHSVRALVRRPNGALPGRTQAVSGDVVTGEGLDRMAGCDAVIHLVGIILEAPGASFERVHYEGTSNVALAAQRSGIQRFIHMSALGARADGVSAYQTTKWRAEEVVRNSGIPFTILRPSLIFGPDDGFVTQMLQVMRHSPLVRPVPGTGKYRFRPIYIHDVITCFLQSLTSDKATNKTIDLVGPEELSLDEILREIAECAGVRKPAVRIPFVLMYMNAVIMQRFMRRPLVTTGQLLMLREGSTADPGPMLQTFSLEPTGFRAGLQSYLCQA